MEIDWGQSSFYPRNRTRRAPIFGEWTTKDSTGVSLQKIWACMTNTICHVKSKNCHIKQLMTKITCHAGRHITTVT